MPRYPVILLVLTIAVLLLCPERPGKTPPTAGETPAAPSLATPQDGMDPFAGILANDSVEVIKTGPSCQIIKVPLPPGVELDEIFDPAKP